MKAVFKIRKRFSCRRDVAKRQDVALRQENNCAECEQSRDAARTAINRMRNAGEQLKNMQSGKWRVLDNSDDITPQCIENTERKLAELDALAGKLAGG
jgi:hypothetical protein